MRNEISSTEKLLGIIRDSSGGDMAEGLSDLKQASGRRWVLGRRLEKRNNITVGIDFGSSEIRLVKARRFSEEQIKLMGYRKVSSDPHVSRESPDFIQPLRAALESFCGSPGRADVWCSLPSSRIMIRRMLIPKIPRKQIANAVLWGLKKEVPFNEDETVFDFKILGEISGDGAERIEVVAWTVPRDEVQYYKDLFYNKLGYPLKGLSLAPFAVQNLLQNNFVEIRENVVGSLYVGRDYSRIDIFSWGNLVLSRWIKSGMNSMIQSILDAVNEGGAGQEQGDSNAENVRAAIDYKQAEKILLSVSSDVIPVSESEAGLHIEKADVYRMIIPALRRLVRQVERSFKHYSLNSSKEEVSKLLTIGSINSFNRVVDYIGKQTGLQCEKVDPLAPGAGFIVSQISEPGSSAGRASFVHAAGMSVAEDTKTPNLLLTHKDRESQANVKRTNMGIFIVFFVIMSFCLGVFMWQGYVKGKKETTLIRLQQDLEQYSPRVDQSYMLELSARAKQKQQTLKEYSKKYMGLAVIGELSRLTTPNVRLLSVKVNLGGIQSDKDKPEKKTLVLEGIVSGDRNKLETSLAAYLLRLENSPILTRPVVSKSNIGYQNDKDALEFTANIELI